jgi:hypothetical protein
MEDEGLMSGLTEQRHYPLLAPMVIILRLPFQDLLTSVRLD